MSDPMQNYGDIVALMELVAQLETEQRAIVDALPAMHEKLESGSRAQYDELGKRANAIAEQLVALNGKIESGLTAHRAEFARLEKAIETRRTEMAEYGRKLETELPKPVETKIKALFAAIPKPQDGAPGAPGVSGKDASLLTGYRGNFVDTASYKKGEWFTFRGSSYLVLQDCTAQVPTKITQTGRSPYYAVFAMSGAPGPQGTPGLNGAGAGGTGLTTKVTMPTATADSGADGQYALDADKMAVYVAGTGWIFLTGYQI